MPSANVFREIKRHVDASRQAGFGRLFLCVDGSGDLRRGAGAQHVVALFNKVA